MVNVTVCPPTGVPGVGSLVVSTPVSVAGWPLVSSSVPCRRPWSAPGVTVNVVVELVGSSCGVDEVSPGNDPVSE